jgi:hypothetical protein
MPATNIVLNGSIGLLSNRQQLAYQGKYFLVTNPTIGTPVVGATIVAWSATANGMFVFANTAASGGPSIVLDRLILRLRSTAPTGALTQQWEAYNEIGIVTGTGNVTTRTPVQGNAAAPQTSVTTCQAFAAGCITIPAAVSPRRQVGSATISTGLGIDGDTYTLQFGADGPVTGKQGITAVRAVDSANIVGHMDPIIVAPGTTTWLNMWWLTQAANVPSWEYAVSWFEL